MDEGSLRAAVGVDGTSLIVLPPSRETGLAEDVSSEMCFRARLAGAVFSSLSALAGFSEICWTLVTSLSSKFALD